MIAWKAKWGYCKGSFIPGNITFTDETFISLPTIMPFPSDFVDRVYSALSSSYKHKGNGALFEQSFGRDYYFASFLINNYYSSGNAAAFNTISNNFASFNSIHPNLNAYFSGANVADYSCCYIPSLKKYIAASLPTSNRTMVIYDENGNAVANAYFVGSASPRSVHGFTVYTGAVNHDELVKSDNYKFFGFDDSGEYYVSDLTDKYMAGLHILFQNYSPPDYTPEIPLPDPDPPDGDIDTGTKLPGGYDPGSDEIPDGIDNWLSASALGMCTVYNPTQSQVRDLATRLFSKDFQSGFENYIWGNPIESIIGLSVFPCPIPDGGTATVKSWGLDTGVTMTLAGSTMVHVNCGSLPVPAVYEGYLDYSPYTQAEIYIPYVGFVGLDADDIMGQNLQLHYYIDIISGTATAKLVISNTSTTTVLGQWACQVGRQIPIGAKDYNDIINAGVQLVTAAVGAYSGSVIPEIVTDLGDALQYEGGGFNGAKFATQMLRAGSSAIMQAKPNITRGSAIASASGQLAVQTPYLILKRPVSAKTNGYGALVGYPTFKYGNIGAYTGFVRCHNIKLDGIGCTDWELSEIFRLCCEGVYI